LSINLDIWLDIWLDIRLDIWLDICPGNSSQWQVVTSTLIVLEDRCRLSLPVESDQPASKIALAIKRLNQPDTHRMAGKLFIVSRLVEPPIEPGGCNFQRVAVWNQILYVENHADFIADQRTILVCDTARLVNVDTQKGVSTSAGQLGMDQLQSFAECDAFDYLLNARVQIRQRHPYEKSGREPTRNQESNRTAGDLQNQVLQEHYTSWAIRERLTGMGEIGLNLALGRQ